MSTYQRVAMVVAAQDQALAQSIATTLANPKAAGQGMWGTALSASGALPATFYITEGPIYAEFAALLGDAQGTFNACQAMGGTQTLTQIQGLYSRATFAQDTDPLALMDKLGLKFAS